MDSGSIFEIGLSSVFFALVSADIGSFFLVTLGG